MTFLIILALLNGCCISFSRILNGKLGQDTSAFNASFWNHVVGFVFLSLVVYLMPDIPMNTILNAPPLMWTGGVIGAVFVALNSYVLTNIGATLTALLVIGGQLLAGVIWDVAVNSIETTQLIGIIFIILGILVNKCTEQKPLLNKMTR